MPLLSWPAAIWLFVAAVTLHNLEEAIWLPRWPAFALNGRFRITPFAFGVAAHAVSVLALLSGLIAVRSGPNSFGAYLICGFALAMVLNVVFPHLIASIWTKSYAPGTGTAVLLNLPAGTELIIKSIEEQFIDPACFAVTGPLTVVASVALLPLLLLGGRLVDALRK